MSHLKPVSVCFSRKKLFC